MRGRQRDPIRATRTWSAALVALLAAAAAVGLGALAPAYAQRQCEFDNRVDEGLDSTRAPFSALVMGPGNVAITISNFGAVGNDHDSRAPSFEYPNGSEIEHLIRGGIWIGAVTADGETLVSTASLDQNIANSSDRTTEFVPLQPLTQRSSLINSEFFDPDAISEQDVLTAYRDYPAPDNANTEDPCPIGIEVQQIALGWSFRPVDDFVILNYTLKNVSTVALTNIYLGMFGEFATNFKGQYAEWPPPSVSVLFDNKEIAWDDSLRLFSEHHCSFDRGRAPTYGAMKLLGSRPDSIAGKTVSFNWFEFFPGDETRDQDVERYQLLSNGEVDRTDNVVTTCDGGATNDPVDLMSVGPYSILLPGDTLSFAVAFLGGDDPRDLELNASWAQRAFDANYVIPQPPPSPAAFVDPSPNGLTVYWDDSPEPVPDPASGELDFQGYRVYVSSNNVEFDNVRDVDIIDSVGFNTGFSEVAHDTTIGGKEYEYRLTIPGLRDGFRYWVAVTSYDLGNAAQGLPSLESGIPQNRALFVPGADAASKSAAREVTVYPNPYRGQAAWDGSLAREKLLWFRHLPERCVVRIFTLAGDLVDEISFDAATYGAEGNFLLNPGGDPPVLSGGQAAWDLLTKDDQPVASGLYFYAVEDLANGEFSTGKFLILK